MLLPISRPRDVIVKVGQHANGWYRKKRNSANASSTPFIRGVPERHQRLDACSAHVATLPIVRLLRMMCASSRMTRHHATLSSLNVYGDVDDQSKIQYE